MRCAACGEETSGSPCGSCGGDPLLAGRYRLDAAVGVGASGTVHRGVDTHTGEAVAIKETPFRVSDDAKARELVAREGRVLRQLSHPGIPRWRDEVVAGRGRSRALFLVQDFVEGRSLAEDLATHRWSEDEVLALLEEVLPVLAYLHERHPPVIHRDLKPGNLLRRADGRLVLVDFGAVRDVLAGARLGGSTVAGTFGYMAPEQFRGHAEPATDLYALGVTAVALLSRQDPASLHDRSGTFRWREAVSLGVGATALLADLLAPDPAARPASARQVLARVRELRAGAWTPPAPRPSPTRAPGRPPSPAILPAPPPRGPLEAEVPYEPPVARPEARPFAVRDSRAMPVVGALLGVGVLLVFLTALAGFFLVRPVPAPPPVQVEAPPAPQPAPAPVPGRLRSDHPVPEASQSCEGLPGLPPSVEGRIHRRSVALGEVRVDREPALAPPPEATAGVSCEVVFVVDPDGLPSFAAVHEAGCPAPNRELICAHAGEWRFAQLGDGAADWFSVGQTVAF